MKDPQWLQYSFGGIFKTSCSDSFELMQRHTWPVLRTLSTITIQRTYQHLYAILSLFLREKRKGALAAASYWSI
jgi:hypothetical protein